MNDGFGAGVLFCFVIAAFLLVGYLFGASVMTNWIGSDCQDYGKTSIKGVWYECRKIEKKATP
jgi:hypothetical protein